MNTKNERTFRMKREYVRLHFNEGLTPKEIAERFQLNPSTVYAEIYAISEETGIPRSELLAQPHRKPVSYDRKFQPVAKLDESVDAQDYAALLDLINRQVQEIEELEKAEGGL